MPDLFRMSLDGNESELRPEKVPFQNGRRAKSAR